MTFYTNKPNEELYVQNRIKKELLSELVHKEKTIDNKEDVTKKLNWLYILKHIYHSIDF